MVGAQSGLRLPSLGGYLPLLGIGAGLLLALYLARKADLLPSVAGFSYDVGSAGVDMVDGVLTGAVETAGSLFGIPKTNLTQCQRDLQAGSWWEASFSCPAKDFLGAGYSKITG